MLLWEPKSCTTWTDVQDSRWVRVSRGWWWRPNNSFTPASTDTPIPTHICICTLTVSSLLRKILLQYMKQQNIYVDSILPYQYNSINKQVTYAYCHHSHILPPASFFCISIFQQVIAPSCFTRHIAQIYTYLERRKTIHAIQSTYKAAHDSTSLINVG